VTSSDDVCNALGFDLEHWYTATLLREAVTDPADHVVESVETVLDILRRHDVTATFFVVGELAAEYPGLIRRIEHRGHELGSHGHTHTPLFELSPAQFERELQQARAAIVDAAGVEPAGFRAPNFSVTRETSWAFDVLRESDHTYDSSVFPLRTPLYGVPGAPRRPYRVSAEDPFTGGAGDSGLDELPVSVVGPRVRLPLAGGFYGRLLPQRLFCRGVRRLNERGLPANLYFHPWEFNPSVYTDEPSRTARFVSFHGIDCLGDLLDSLLSQFDFGPVERLRSTSRESTTGDHPDERSAL